VLIAVALAWSTACGGDRASFRVGFVEPCDASNLAVEEQLAGAELPFVRRGAKPIGTRPSEGVGKVKIEATDVELVIGCSSGSTSAVLDEARRIVEKMNADAVVVAGLTDPGIKDYARGHADVTFFPGGWWGQSLQRPIPNFFSFLGDAHQLTAGLGTYAYRDLGWRTAAVVGEDYAYPYGEAAGFIGEFCALGGKVVKRVWMPSGPPSYAPYVAQIPKDVDGYFVSVAFGNFTKLVQSWPTLPAKLGGTVLTGQLDISETEYRELGDRLIGVSAVGPLTDPNVEAAVGELLRAFPKAGFEQSIGQLAYGLLVTQQVEILLQALEAVDGDPGDDQERLRDALHRLAFRPRTFGGAVRVDSRGQHVIEGLQLFRVEKDEDGKLMPTEFRRVASVDQTFGGLFGPQTPPFGRTSPPCVKR
jgi:branched-chain amino acid transport system substrate-binding protein